MGNENHTEIYDIEEITPAEYHRSDPVPTPIHWQEEGVAYCSHDHLKGNCRHKECKHYAPSLSDLKREGGLK